jgi:hypothetical protein
MCVSRILRPLVAGLLLLGTTISSAAADPAVCVDDEDAIACPGPTDLDATDDAALSAPVVVDATAPTDTVQSAQPPSPDSFDTDIPTPGGVTRSVPSSTVVQPFTGTGAPSATTETVAPMPSIPLPEHLPPGPASRAP